MSDPKAMRERPILFSAPMVRAILAGTKTQTRRIVKKLSGATAVKDVYHRPDGLYIGLHLPVGSGVGITNPFPCPYGALGDLLWVREAAAFCDYGNGLRLVNYRATPDGETSGISWRPSIHMPRWASRITLRITGVRIERLQDISEADAEAEGVNRIKSKVPTHIDAYRYLWDEINGAGSWDANPWTWVVSFERMP